MVTSIFASSPVVQAAAPSTAATGSPTTTAPIDGDELRQALQDKVSISPEAREKYNESTRKAEDSAFTWESRFGLQNGTTKLDNGTTRVVNIEGSHLEIQEFSGGKLVTSITGDILADSVVLDTEMYDARGKVNQTIHTELRTTENDKAEMTRSLQWLDNGTLTRSMQESMTLSSSYKKFFELDADTQYSMQDFISGDAHVDPDNLAAFTYDDHINSYAAEIQEYKNGALVRETAVHQDAEYTNLTNRSGRRAGDMEADTTQEVYHDISLSVETREYDMNGDLLRTVSYSESHADGIGPEDGGMQQNLAVSWYANGELIKKSSGQLTMHETENAMLPDRPTLLQMLGMEQEEYVTPEPESSTEIMSKSVLDGAAEADHYAKGLKQHMGQGHFDTAKDIAEWGVRGQPYSVSWTNEVYAEGEIVAQQVDKESAIVNPSFNPIDFRVGGGLTENEDVATLRRTSHTDVGYENGAVKRRATVSSHEYVTMDENGVDRLKTYSNGVIAEGIRKESIDNVYNGGIEAHDNEHNAASFAMGREIEMMSDDVYETFRALAHW